jgi:hypothetical protein
MFPDQYPVVGVPLFVEMCKTGENRAAYGRRKVHPSNGLLPELSGDLPASGIEVNRAPRSLGPLPTDGQKKLLVRHQCFGHTCFLGTPGSGCCPDWHLTQK